MKKIIYILLLSLINLLSIAQQKPNIVFILIDDMGISDLQSFGASFYETSNIDELASKGMKFRNAYTSAPICSPARASALTGRHPMKIQMWNHRHHMPKDSITVAKVLKDAGYSTWHVGKWHAGCFEDGTLPEQMGFDINIGGGNAFQPPSFFWPYKKNKNKSMQEQPVQNRIHNLPDTGEEGEYLTDRLTHEAIKLIENHDGKTPFYLNMWHYAVHMPFEAPEDLVEKYRQKAQKYYSKNQGFEYDARGVAYVTNPNLPASSSNKNKNAPDFCYIYAAMIENLDTNIGRLIKALEDKNVLDNTMIIFYSDNGPVTNYVLKPPYRGGKNSVYEGGVREPAFIVWNKKIPADSNNYSQINIFDLPYTMLDAAGTSFPEGYVGDGQTLLPILTTQQKTIPNRDFFWYFPSSRPGWGQYSSMSYKDKENFKYVMMFNGEKDELYDLNIDPMESNNLLDKYPQRAKEMEDIVRKELAKYHPSLPDPDQPYVENVKLRLQGKPATKINY